MYWLIGIGVLVFWIFGWAWIHENDPSLSNKNGSMADIGVRLFISFIGGFIAIMVGVVTLCRWMGKHR